MTEKQPTVIVGNDYLRFEDVIHKQLPAAEGQYVSRYVDGSLGCPNLGEGLRFIGDPIQWARLRIHKDDVEEFIKRYNTYKEKKRKEMIALVASLGD
jgi:hypothetical protein